MHSVTCYGHCVSFVVLCCIAKYGEIRATSYYQANEILISRINRITNAPYYTNLVERGCTIQGEVLIEESALNEAEQKLLNSNP